ncbi:MAG: hypothetical protein PHG55_02670 [Verrucomicrobiota bacterium]|nr:hypothetical protein [Verrucomicrobiota bacterium]MDD8050219.1 hypothetical protein [Verrucomicrobiota bacterium]
MYYTPRELLTGSPLLKLQINDVRGTANDEAFDINAEGGIETVPSCGFGIRYQHLGWAVDGRLKFERHIADWDWEDQISGRYGEVGNYTAWAVWLGLSAQI